MKDKIESLLNDFYKKLKIGFFETMKSEGEVIFFYDEHIERLNKSLRYFKLPKVDPKILKEEILEKLNKKKYNSARIKLDYVIDRNKLRVKAKVAVYKLKRTIPDNASIKISYFKQEHGEQNRKHKSLMNLLFLDKKIKSIKKHGYDEEIYFDTEGHLLEGMRTNIFIVKSGNVSTPKLTCGILPGITRSVVIKICRELKIPIVEKLITKKQLLQANEIFLTNSINGVVPVKIIEKRVLKKFEITSLIRNAYEAKLTEQLK